MKKTLKVNLALYALSETQLDNLVSEFCGHVMDIVGKAKAHEIEFNDEGIERDNGPAEVLSGIDNATLFSYALTCFKLKSP